MLIEGLRRVTISLHIGWYYIRHTDYHGGGRLDIV